jgi:photosystem II stability/assembly factor-like uncharacterized protein
MVIGTGFGTAWRRPLAWLALPGLLIAAGACGGAAPATVRSTLAPSGGALTVLSASFVSASAGWLLATPCADQVPTCRTIVLLKTSDGGRTWSGAHAPGAPPADMFQGSPPANAVGTILFTSARAGWAYGPALWQTRDGGLTWRRMRGPGGPVQDLGVAADRVLAVTSRCDGSACTFRVYAAPDGSDDWRTLPGAIATGARSAQLAVSGDVAYLFATPAGAGRPVLAGGPVNGAAPWRSRSDPCSGASSGALAAAPGGWLFLGCGLEPGAGNQVKTAYLSHDGARSWRKVASPPFGGYLAGASMSPGGTIFLSGERMDVYISWDRGRTWHESPSLRNAAGLAGAGFPLTALTVTDTWGFAFQEGVHPQQVWLSRDGGRHWTTVTIR